jgi:MtN3 and saliva related transmembrane protein
MHIIGYIGLISLAACWVPQTLQTIREKDCKANMQFLVLSFVGSMSLMIYAILLGDIIFSILNFMTSAGALINFIYKIRAMRTAL